MSSFTDILNQYKATTTSTSERSSTNGDDLHDKILEACGRVDLLKLVYQDTGDTGEGHGNIVYFRGECPVCHHRDCFRVHRDTDTWSCHSESMAAYRNPGAQTVGGNVLDYLKWARHDGDNRAAMSELETLTGITLGLAADTPSKAVRNAGTPKFRDGAKFLHAEVGHYLIDEYHACMVDGITPAIWNGHRYICGWDGIDTVVVDLVDDSKIRERKEVEEWLKLKAPKVDPAPPNRIAFANGVLDIVRGTMTSATPDEVIANVIPHDYDAGAYDANVDRFLDDVSCGNAATRANLEETIGLCLYRKQFIGICIVLVGNGANGKSVFLKALENALGEDNYSSLHLSMLGNQFAKVVLVGKLANIGDDISKSFVNADKMTAFKSIVQGAAIHTDVKNKTGFDFKPYCTLVFSANEMPRLEDHGDGTMRRLYPIEFAATFTRGTTGYDPFMDDKVTTSSAARYILRLGVEGLRRVLTYKGMTPNERGAEILEDIRQDNDAFLKWVDDAGITSDWLISCESVGGAYHIFSTWCADAGVKSPEQRRFTKRANKVFDLETYTTTALDRSKVRRFRQVTTV